MNRLQKFIKSETGTLSVETVIMFPLLLWAFGATFLFWDLFHAHATSQRAAYTVADAISREENAINQTYMNGMDDVHTYLTQGQHATRLRITALIWNEDDAEFNVAWSRTPDGNWAEHTDASINDVADQIPNMAAGDCAILVESQMRYIPFMNVGLDPMVLENFVITRPRFGPQLVWEDADGTLTWCVSAA